MDRPDQGRDGDCAGECAVNYPDDYIARRNPQEHRLNRDQSHQVDVTHDVLDALEKPESALTRALLAV